MICLGDGRHGERPLRGRVLLVGFVLGGKRVEFAVGGRAMVTGDYCDGVLPVSQSFLRHKVTCCLWPSLERCDPLRGPVTRFGQASSSAMQMMEENGFPIEVRKLILLEWGAVRPGPGYRDTQSHTPPIESPEKRTSSRILGANEYLEYYGENCKGYCGRPILSTTWITRTGLERTNISCQGAGSGLLLHMSQGRQVRIYPRDKTRDNAINHSPLRREQSRLL